MVIDSTDSNRLNLAKQELHQMMESDVSLQISAMFLILMSFIIAITKR